MDADEGSRGGDQLEFIDTVGVRWRDHASPRSLRRRRMGRDVGRSFGAMGGDAVAGALQAVLFSPYGPLQAVPEAVKGGSMPLCSDGHDVFPKLIVSHARRPSARPSVRRRA